MECRKIFRNENKIGDYMIKWITLILLLALLLLSLWNAKFVMVYQMGRHGYRSSNITKRGLLQDDSLSFRKGKNSLTNQGLRQTFERGQDLAERYPTLFRNIDFSRIKIRSTKPDWSHWRLYFIKFCYKPSGISILWNFLISEHNQIYIIKLLFKFTINSQCLIV